MRSMRSERATADQGSRAALFRLGAFTAENAQPAEPRRGATLSGHVDALAVLRPPDPDPAPRAPARLGRRPRRARARTRPLGVHEPGFMPFNHPWTAVEPDERALGGVPVELAAPRARSRAEKWSLNLLVVASTAQVVGTQSLMAEHFADVARRADAARGSACDTRATGSARRCAPPAAPRVRPPRRPARGLGRVRRQRMRSLGVSRALGYEDDGEEWQVRGHRGGPRAGSSASGSPGSAGRQHRPDLRVTVEGLEPCLPLLGDHLSPFRSGSRRRIPPSS